MNNTYIDDFKNEITIIDTPWDQKVLGQKSCEIKITFKENKDALLSLFEQVYSILEDKYQFVQCRCDSNDRVLKKLLSDNYFYFVENSFTLSFSNPQKLEVGSINRFNVELLELTTDDASAINIIKKIAFNDFHHGRLLEDIHINEVLARQRSENWIDDLMKPPFRIYKAMFRGELVGFHAEKISITTDSVDWILTGVSKKHSVYALAVWCSAFSMAQKNGIKKISTMVSGANTKVINLYNCFPFRIENSWFGYHKKL